MWRICNFASFVVAVVVVGRIIMPQILWIWFYFFVAGRNVCGAFILANVWLWDRFYACRCIMVMWTQMSQKTLWMTSIANFPKSNNTQTMHKICTMRTEYNRFSKWKCFSGRFLSLVRIFFFLGRACEFSLRIETMWPRGYLFNPTVQLIAKRAWNVHKIWMKINRGYINYCDGPIGERAT